MIPCGIAREPRWRTRATFAIAQCLALLVLADCSSATPYDAGDSGLDAGFAIDCTTVPPRTDAGMRPPISIPSLETIERACALAFTCNLIEFIPQTQSECVAMLTEGFAGTLEALLPGFAPGEFSQAIECARDAVSCEDLRRCASRGHDRAYCDAHRPQFCDGDVLVHCMATYLPLVTSVDCAAWGMRCRETSSGALCTTGRTCGPSSGGGAAAPDAGGASHCEGARAVRCDSGLESVFDCAIGGLSCGLSMDVPGCTASGTACAVAGRRCDRDTLVDCSYGREVRIDCPSLFHGHCVAPDAGGGARCVSDFVDCAATDGDRCSGTSMVACVNGRYACTADCQTLGFDRCTWGENRPARCAR